MMSCRRVLEKGNNGLMIARDTAVLDHKTYGHDINGHGSSEKLQPDGGIASLRDLITLQEPTDITVIEIVGSTQLDFVKIDKKERKRQIRA